MNNVTDPASNPTLTAEFSQRLVTLSDGRRGIRTGLHVAASPPPSEIRDDSSNSCLDFVASDSTLDRYGEIISAEGWRLEAYRRNPVFQNAHQYGDILFTLGKAVVTEVRSSCTGRALSPKAPSSDLQTPERSDLPTGRGTLNPQSSELLLRKEDQPSTYLFQRIEFATGVNPMARIAYGLYKGKFLNAVSVGFLPIRWENGDQAPSAAKGVSAAAPAVRRRYLEQELLEVSAVGIPANPNALALGLKAGAIEVSDLRELADLLRGLCHSDFKPGGPAFGAPASPTPAPDFAVRDSQPFSSSHPAAAHTPTGALGVPGNEAQWLRLAREIRQLLKRA